MDLASALQASRRAAEQFSASARAVPDAAWSTPRAPGKWTTAQIVEHVAISIDVARRAIRGEEKFPPVPRFLRPLARAIAFTPVIRRGRFPEKSRTTASFLPSPQPAPRDALLARLASALDAFEREVQERDRTGKVRFEHGVFGTLALGDYVRFVELHILHHREQLPNAR